MTNQLALLYTYSASIIHTLSTKIIQLKLEIFVMIIYRCPTDTKPAPNRHLTGAKPASNRRQTGNANIGIKIYARFITEN